jgi:hypothetical protein
MEHWCNDIDREKLTYEKKDLSQCHFSHHITDVDFPEIEPGPPW